MENLITLRLSPEFARKLRDEMRWLAMHEDSDFSDAFAYLHDVLDCKLRRYDYLTSRSSSPSTRSTIS